MSQQNLNIMSAYQHPEVVHQKIQKELRMGRIAGPFANRPLPTFRVTPIDLVPKKESNDFCLIHHLSYPFGLSVNDFIDSKHCSVQYTSFDGAIHLVQDLGRNRLLFKSDVSNAFRLLPLAISELNQLGFKFLGQYYEKSACHLVVLSLVNNGRFWLLFSSFMLGKNLDACIYNAI